MNVLQIFLPVNTLGNLLSPTEAGRDLMSGLIRIFHSLATSEVQVRLGFFISVSISASEGISHVKLLFQLQMSWLEVM